MNILDELNKKISLYQPPKLNWLTKRLWLLNCLHFAVIATVFLGCIVCIDSQLGLASMTSATETVLKVLLIFGVGPVSLTALNMLLFKYKYPLQEKVVEEYTECILRRFSKSEYHEVKIKLLKILNNEPYTPVSFLDDILQCKYRFDQRQKGKECVEPVKEPLNLTVLIEKMEEEENENLYKKDVAHQKHIQSISKL